MNDKEKTACGDWLPLLSKYCDDELTRGERERVDGHLAACLNCRNVLEQFRGASRSLALDVSMPAGRRERLIGLVMGRIGREREVRSAPDWSEWLRRIFSAPVLATAALLFFVMWRVERTDITGPGRLKIDSLMAAADERLLQSLSGAYGGQVAWIGIRDGDVRVGLPEDMPAEGVTVFGRDQYIRLVVELSPASPAASKPDVLRLMVREGAEASMIYAPDDRHRIRLACRAIRRGSEQTLEIRVTVLGQSELKTVLPLSSGDRRKAGEILMDGALYSVTVMSGNSITLAPDALRL